MENDMELFCKNLPKLELHAHLGGSLSASTLCKLHQAQRGIDADASWNESETIISYGESRTLEECFKLFGVAHSLTNTPEAVRQAAEDVIYEFAQDNVLYLELRSTPREVPNVMTKLQYIEEIVNAIKKLKNFNGITTKLLVSIDRCQGPAEAKRTLALASYASQKYPDIVVGIDLSGDPTKGNITEYLPVLQEGRKKGLKITIHCAEVPQLEEVKTILAFKPDRIGHGTCIHPSTGGSEELWEALIASRVPVEACLTSNVKCKTVESYETHHFKHLFDCRHPLSLSTDDKGVFSTSLSKEFFIAAETFHLSKKQLWKICSDSISFIFATDEEKLFLEATLLAWKFRHQELNM